MVTLGRDLGGGESLTSTLGPLTATLSGAANLVEGVIFPPRPSSSLRWWWSFALFGEFLLLRLPSLGCIYIVRVASVVIWRMLCRRCSGGCFAAIVVLVENHLGRMLCRRG